MNMANNVVVRCVRIANSQVQMYVLGQQVNLVDLHVIPARTRAYPLTRKTMVVGYESKTRLASWGIRIVHR